MRRAKRALTKLKSHESPVVGAIASALCESLADTLSPEERKLIDAIEERRSSLLSSEAEIEIVDYGAGKPGDNRTAEEMERGFTSTAQLSRICKASKPAFWAKILFKTIRKLQPTSCVELGSCVGISASYQAAALALNGKGQLWTLEGSPEIARTARETLEGLNLSGVEVVTGPFHETLQTVLQQSAPIDFFFNDGHHDHDAVLNYLNDAVPFLAPNAVIVVDDIAWSEGMKKAWSEIESDKRVAATVDLGLVGIAVMGSRMPNAVKLRVPL